MWFCFETSEKNVTSTLYSSTLKKTVSKKLRTNISCSKEYYFECSTEAAILFMVVIKSQSASHETVTSNAAIGNHSTVKLGLWKLPM